MRFEHSGDSNELYTQFLSHTYESYKGETRVCGYISKDIKFPSDPVHI